jgi:hypothetical protein
MELTRIGANRKEVRSTAFTDRRASLTIDAETGSLVLFVNRGEGMGQSGQYDYTVTLTTQDLTDLFDSISNDRSAFQVGPLQAALGASAAAIFRMLSAATSLPFQLAPTDAQLRFQAARRKLDAKRSAGEA